MKSRIKPQNNMDELRALALTFLELEPERNEKFPFVVYHPFFETCTVPKIEISDNGEKTYGIADIFNEPEEFEKAKERIREDIIKGDIGTILCRIVKAYRLTYLKYAKEFIDKDEFEKLLIEQWIMSENPNQDANISIDEFIKWFSQADRKNLMNKEEMQYFNNLPDEVNIYRGIAVGRAEQDGLSWTCNYDTAKWFANRFNHGDKTGYIVKGTIAKKDIFAYLNGRNEDEILCNSKKIYNVERVSDTDD